jgi:hypothetical protein
LDFLLWSENFKGSLKKENEVLRVFLFGLFIWPNWELGNQPLQAIFCNLAATIVPPRSLELKLEAKEPSMEEAMRCKLKLPVKRTAHIRCGGRVPTGALASRNPVEGDDRSSCGGRPSKITTSTFGTSSPKRGLPKAPTAMVTMAMRAATTMEVATTAVTMVETMAIKTPSYCIRCVVELAVNPSGISTRRSMNVSKPWKR